MPTERGAAGPSSQDDAWRQIEELIDRVAALSSTGAPEEEFHRAVLDAAVQAGAAEGGAVWLADQRGQLRLVCQANLPAGLAVGDRESLGPHREFLHAAMADGRPATAPPRSGGGDRVNNPTDHLLVACPVVVDGREVALLELFQRPELSPDAQRNYMEVLTTLGDLVAEFHRNRWLRTLRDGQAWWSQVERFSERVHRALDLDATAYTLANEARRLAGCQRATVALRRGAGFTVRAISGLDTVDARSNAVRGLQQLVQRVAAMGEPLWYSGQRRDLPPEIDTAVQDYVDSAHARHVAVIPLTPPASDPPAKDAERAVGAVVFECFDAGPAPADYRQRIEVICRHGATALANAVDHSSIPLIGLLQRLRWFVSASRSAKLLGTLAAIVLVVALLLLVDADFSVSCRGQLQPKVRRKVFAPLDGQVVELAASHGQAVTAGCTLATLRSNDLELRYTQVLGEIQTTTEQLHAVNASRLGKTPTSASERSEYARMSAEEERLKKQLANLHQQRELLDGQRQQLQVRSPIDGHVLTWEVAETLQARPVKRGQALMTVADTSGPWVLELRVPDKYAGFVRDARQAGKEDLDVTFMLATEPGTTRRGKVDRIALRAEPDETGALTVRVIVALELGDVGRLRPGTGATARIHCGRRALGYVWLHDLIEAIRARLFL